MVVKKRIGDRQTKNKKFFLFSFSGGQILNVENREVVKMRGIGKRNGGIR